MRTLPLLDFAASRFKHLNFSKTAIVGCQHLLPSNLIMFHYLFEKGLKPVNTFLVGKVYSTHKNTSKNFEKMGVYLHKYKYSSHQSFEEQFSVTAKSFLNFVENKIGSYRLERVILVDDGGEIIKQVSRNGHFGDVKIVGVEQTTSGYEKLAGMKERLLLPIINVARSNAKLNVESPYIAKAVIQELNKRLIKHKIKPKRILVVGDGAIGRNLFNQLSRKYEVALFDILPHKSHFNSDLETIVPSHNVIVGSAGNTILSRLQFKVLKRNTVLVSASSSDIEFESTYLRQQATETDNLHADILAEGIILLNSGFPINFNGTELENLEDIQLTRALMFSAICLAKNNNYL